MTKFESNIIRMYKTDGKKWLSSLPSIVDRLAKKWNLEKLRPVENLSYNYVLSGFRHNLPVVLKISPCQDSLTREKIALAAMKKFGAIAALEKENGAILLQQACPGFSLKTYFPERDNEAVKITAQVIAKLHQAPIPNELKLPRVGSWMGKIDQNLSIPLHYARMAIKLKKHLIQSTTKSVLLHGDLHHDNILKNQKDWLIIDPKGVIGDTPLEVATFIYNPIPELLETSKTQEIIENRINAFSKLLGFEKERIVQWCFVKTILAWIWAQEDGLDTTYFRTFASIVFQLL